MAQSEEGMYLDRGSWFEFSAQARQTFRPSRVAELLQDFSEKVKILT